MRRLISLAAVLVVLLATRSHGQTTMPTFSRADAAALIVQTVKSVASQPNPPLARSLVSSLPTMGVAAIPALDELWQTRDVWYADDAFQAIKTMHTQFPDDRQAYDILIRTLNDVKLSPVKRFEALSAIFRNAKDPRIDASAYQAAALSFTDFSPVTNAPNARTLHQECFERMQTANLKPVASIIWKYLQVPALMDTDAHKVEVLTLLGLCGMDATPVVPQLRTMLEDTNLSDVVRQRASATLVKIALDTAAQNMEGQVLTNVPNLGR